ncbi:putative bifunctional diguanylate cyclase/phosphodiesterase [Jannaschia sp. R86511]|uniref:putative bifunctional diguanylate cyclase/phosphodiesterase n=1 Tax=Jannaschia sp. R86511 TaxID=3093853 RepID=UPI0036D3C2CB
MDQARPDEAVGGGPSADVRRRLLEHVLDLSPVATLVVGTDGRVVDANPAFRTLLGSQDHALPGSDVVELVVPQDRPLIAVETSARESGRDRGVLTCRLLTADGRHRWTRFSWTLVPPVNGAVDDAEDGAPGPVRHVVVHVSDVEAEARAALVSDELLAAVEAERSVLDAALEVSPDGLALLHAERDEHGAVVDARLVRMSRAGARGRPLEELTGRTMRDYFPEAEQTGLYRDTMTAFETQQTQRLLVEVGADGSWPGLFENVLVAIDHDRVLCTFRDVTRERRDEQRLLHAATHDALTGLPNRVLLRDRIEHALQRTQRDGGAVTIAFLDLDGFKTLNDTRGHRFGDEVLRVVADRLSGSVREQDTVARLGGDEFVLVLEGCADEEGWRRAYDRVSRALAEPMDVEGQQVSLRASTGVVLAPAGEVDADAVMRNADIAMYASKSGGKARYTVLTEEHHRAVLDQAVLEDDLRAAVAEQQFVLHRQPIVDVLTDAVVGHEVLLRWQHPRRGLLAPTAFLPGLETAGSMVQVGAWLVHEALARSREVDAGRGGLVTINVAVQQLVRSDFVATVREALAATSTPPGSLVVELTESQMLPSRTSVLVQLEELRALGVRVAVDDFGTGYSSLSHLADLPVDIVKVDGSFLVGVEDARRVAVLRSAVELTQAVGAECLVEGVETEHQLELVRATGARYAQGFLLGRPAPL